MYIILRGLYTLKCMGFQHFKAYGPDKINVALCVADKLQIQVIIDSLHQNYVICSIWIFCLAQNHEIGI